MAEKLEACLSAGRSYFRRSAGAIGAALTLGVALLSPPIAAAQDLVPPSPAPAIQKADEQKPAPPEQEVGGRLVVSGDTVIVVADPDRPPHGASIASKIEVPLAETPRSVSVTERQTLDDRLATNIADAHDYTVSLMPADERGPAFSRGFRVSFYDLRRDGLRTYAWSVREPVAVERVQYLRGPAAVLYGDGSPGGLVNMVLRKPLPVSRTEMTASGGGLGFGRVTGDVTGPVGATERVRYRVIGAAEWLGNGIDNDERRLSLMPMVSFDLGRTATLHVDSEIYHQRGRNYWHMVPTTADTQRGDFSKIPWDLNTASPDDQWSGWNVSPGARLDVRLGDATSLHTATRYTRIGGDLDVQALSGLAPDGFTATRNAYRELSAWQELQSDTFLTTVLQTGRIEHKLVVGAEAGLSTTDSEIGVAPAPSINIYAPVYPPRRPDPPLRPTSHDEVRLGVYVQDQFRLHPSLIVVPGIRTSRLNLDDRIGGSDGRLVERQSTEIQVSPSLGVLVLPRPWLSIYANGVRGFEPPTPGQFLDDGSPLSLAEATAFEGGVKVEALGGRLAASGGAFRIRRTNVPEADGRGFYRQIGDGRSHGIEAELNGRLAPGLGVQASYAWTDTEITRSLTGTVGRELPNAPHHNASVWTRYRVLEGTLAGTMLAAGVVHVSDRFLAGNNVVIAPAYTRLDLSGSYELKARRLRIGVAMANATNIRYATSGAGQVLYAGAPRRVVIQLTSWF